MPGGMERGFLLVQEESALSVGNFRRLYNSFIFDTMKYKIRKVKQKRCTMKATVIVDNIRTEELHGEWGLCVYIEYNDKTVLLDAGSSGLFAENAKALGFDLADVEYGVLSHAHYDHGNGMEQFFRINSQAKFYVSSACRENCYSQKTYYRKYIGIPKGILKKYKDRIVYASGDHQLAEGITLVPHKGENLEEIGRREKMYLKVKGGFKADNFAHEQSLVFDTPKGLVIFNSCCHGGAANVINEVAETFPEKKVLALIGGFHLYNKTENEVRELAAKIKETGIQHIYTGHCTGEKAFEILRQELGECVQQLHVGLEMEF